MRGGEHRAARRNNRGEAHESDWLLYVVVDGFHAAGQQVSFMPEAGAAGILEERFPPVTMRLRARPGQKRFHIAPVLANADVRGKHGEKKEFVHKKAIRVVGGRFRDLRAEAEEGFQPGEPVHAHPKINDDEIGIARKVDGAAIRL